MMECMNRLLYGGRSYESIAVRYLRHVFECNHGLRRRTGYLNTESTTMGPTSKQRPIVVKTRGHRQDESESSKRHRSSKSANTKKATDCILA